MIFEGYYSLEEGSVKDKLTPRVHKQEGRNRFLKTYFSPQQKQKYAITKLIKKTFNLVIEFNK